MKITRVVFIGILNCSLHQALHASAIEDGSSALSEEITNDNVKSNSIVKKFDLSVIKAAEQDLKRLNLKSTKDLMNATPEQLAQEQAVWEKAINHFGVIKK